MSSTDDVVLMDLHMPGCNGVEVTDALTTARRPRPVVVLTTYADDEWVFAALRAGRAGSSPRTPHAEEIRHALTTVAAGQAQLDPSVQRRLLEALASGSAASRPLCRRARPVADAVRGGARRAHPA